jgi:DNA topoisomerase-1
VEEKEIVPAAEKTAEPAKQKVKPKKKKKAAEKKPGKGIILVESPTKVKTIKKFVKNKYEVLATKGHVMDLPKSRLGIDTENNFEPTYIDLLYKKNVLSEQKK